MCGHVQDRAHASLLAKSQFAIAESDDYVEYPGPKERMHCVLVCLPASDFTNPSNLSKSHMTWLNSVRRVAHEHGKVTV